MQKKGVRRVMTLQQLWNSGIRFLDLAVVYFALQLVRCAVISVAVVALILIVRQTVLKNCIFLKGAMWGMLLPVPFMGRMKFFYENWLGVKLFSWLTVFFMRNLWVCRLYLLGVLLCAAVLFRRRRRIGKMAAGMEKRRVNGTAVCVTRLPVAPSAVGAFRPVIVMPEVLLAQSGEDEIRMILLHEKTHIRLGHLLFYVLWDMLRALLWPNPLLFAGMRLLREDMEEICDRVTIQRSRGDAYRYGQLLLKSMRILQSKKACTDGYAAFTGNHAYANVRRRIGRIVRFRPYRRLTAFSVWILALAGVLGTVLWTHNVSYGRYTESEYMVLYEMETETKLTGKNEMFQEAVSYDGRYVYIEPGAFRELMEKGGMPDGHICICFGGYYKLPGIGGGSNFGYVDVADLQSGMLKIPYDSQEDLFCRILKLL